ncbi:MAG: aminoglycoside phosphotransferase family protein [Caldilineaceae bacterium]|nr:aminoglycoside phosphotransferase family protein [Caldilineaceae bacterium]
MMLKTTLSTTFTPGINLKGEAVGANWAFLLPTMPQQTVLILGLPTAATLTMVGQLAQRIRVICRTPNECQSLERLQRQVALPDLASFPFVSGTALPLAAQQVDLVLVTDRPQVQWLQQTPALQQEIQRLLAPTGLLYYEYRGQRDPLQGLFASTVSAARPAALIGTSQAFWLTPLWGERQTAVPLADQATSAYALAHDLYRPSADLATWKGLLKTRLGKRTKGQRPPQATPQTGRPRKKARRLTTLRRRVGLWAKRLLVSGSAFTEGLEKRLYQWPWVRSRFQRRGVLFQQGAELTAAPPAYLRVAAQSAGIALENYRWFLSAKGEYRSRKVLFFLFAPGAETPTYIVKMTRDPALNGRVENEYQALVQLEACDMPGAVALPKALFLEEHAHLALVGETIIAGRPFNRYTQRSATCPYLQAAVSFFSELGMATRNTNAVSPATVATALETLLNRFQAIYQLTPAHAAFLADQIAQVRLCPQPFPLVFQHGDPGPWNMLITPADQLAVLDWEAAEPQGMPLWDLLYFLRSYCIDVARAQGITDAQRGFQSQFLADTPLGRFVADTIHHYCTAIGLPLSLIKPLFYTCWMHRALKEATRLPVGQVETGRFVTLLRLCIDQPETPTLQRLMSIVASDESGALQRMTSETW